MRKLLFFFLTFTVSSSAISQSITDSLKAYYSFENNFIDSSGNNNHLSLRNGGVTFTPRVGNNMAANFNGISSLRNTNPFNNSTYTQCAVSYWVKASTASSSRQVLVQGAFLGFGTLIRNGSNILQGWYDNSAAGPITSIQSVVDSNWHHIVHQNNGTLTDLYIDGVLNSRISETFNRGTGGSNARIYIGQSNLGIEGFTGQIDEVRVYNRILTTAEINILSQLVTSIGENSLAMESPAFFPNPSAGEFYFEANASLLGSQLIVRNIMGQNIQQELIMEQGLQTLSIEGENGIYFIEIIAPNGSRTTSKVVKQN